MNRLRCGRPDACLPPLFLCAQATNARGAAITVDATKVQGYINPLVFGQNVFFAGSDIWDHEQDSLTTIHSDATGQTIASRVRDLAPAILRFPGGTASDLYLWEDGLGFRTRDDGGRIVHGNSPGGDSPVLG